VVTGRKGILFFQRGGLSSVSLTTQPSFRFGNPAPATNATFLATSGPSVPRSYDITPDGKRFIRGLRQIQVGRVGQQIQVVLNWFSELNARVPTK
jgi:hypothetical protein